MTADDVLDHLLPEDWRDAEEEVFEGPTGQESNRA